MFASGDKCSQLANANQHHLVVPANAGTHTPRPLDLAPGPDGFLTTNIGGYGSRRSPGRHSDSDLLVGLFCNLRVHPRFEKYSASRFGRSSFIDSAIPPLRGAYRDRHGRGVGCGGRSGTRRASTRGRMAQLRTAKPCGPGAPTLASSLRESANDGGKKARSPGRARNKPLKPLRRKRREAPGEPVANTLVCTTHFAHEAAGAAGTRRFLRPLFSEGIAHANLGRVAPRERGRVFEIGCLKFESVAMH
jgi:hypothetical protein